jgi:hypothetical protein
MHIPDRVLLEEKVEDQVISEQGVLLVLPSRQMTEIHSLYLEKLYFMIQFLIQLLSLLLEKVLVNHLLIYSMFFQVLLIELI